MSYLAFRWDNDPIRFMGKHYDCSEEYLAAITKLDICIFKTGWVYIKSPKNPLGYESEWRFIDIPEYNLTLKLKYKDFCRCGCGDHCITFFFLQNGEQITFSKAMDIIHGEYKDRKKEIKVPFPKYEGMEVKKVTADIEKGYSVVEYGEKEPEFKNGDICKLGNNEIHIFDKRRDGSEYDKNFFNRKVVLLLDSGKLYFDVEAFGYFGQLHRLANNEEQQVLFDALAKDGKKWNDDTKEVEPIEKDILVPESIGIYKHKYRLDLGLFIAFNNDNQYLGYHPFNKQWIVTSETHKYAKVQCKLTPCKREDLKEGDTGFCCEENKDFGDIMNYMKVLKDGAYDFVWIEDEANISLCTESDDLDYSFFKVEPIK